MIAPTPRSVLIYLPALPCGGVERITIRMIRALLERGVRVHLALSRWVGEYIDTIPPGVEPIVLGTDGVFSSARRLAREIDRIRPDSVFTAKDYGNVVALVARRISRHPHRTVISVRVNVGEHVRNASRMRVRLIPAVGRFLYPGADAVVAVSRGVKEDLVARAMAPRDRIHVIHNPIDLDEVERGSREPVPAVCPAKRPGVFRIVNVARFDQQKDHPTLIRAFARVRAVQEAELLLVGDGDPGCTAAAHRLAKELGIEADVHFLGAHANPYPIVASADVFALSSAWEGFGNVLLEALALGVPVVSTDCPSGPREILDDGRYGRLVPVRDPAALANAIVETADHRPDGQLLRDRAAQFSVEDVVHRYLEVLR